MTYRNPVLLRLARLAPHCMGCQARNVGQVVAAHSNAGADGKGMGLKASDACVAFVCDRCHHEIDQGGWSQEQKRFAWLKAYVATMRWLFESGHLAVLEVAVAPAKPLPKPSRPIPKGPKLQGRSTFPTGRKLQSALFPKKPPR